MKFTEEDRRTHEQRIKSACILAADGLSIHPVTHLGDQYAADIDVPVRPLAGFPGQVSWRILERSTGRRVLSGHELFWSTPGSFAQAARRAIRMARQYGCSQRVWPGVPK